MLLMGYPPRLNNVERRDLTANLLSHSAVVALHFSTYDRRIDGWKLPQRVSLIAHALAWGQVL